MFYVVVNVYKAILTVCIATYAIQYSNIMVNLVNKHRERNMMINI